MGKTMKTRGYFFLFILFSANSQAQEVVYRWVDRHNVVHFSHQPPADTQFTELYIKQRQHKPPVETSNAVVADDSTKLANEFTNNAIQLCENAKDNIAKLKMFEKIRVTDAEGNGKELSELEKLQQIKLSERQIEVYCK